MSSSLGPVTAGLRSARRGPTASSAARALRSGGCPPLAGSLRTAAGTRDFDQCALARRSRARLRSQARCGGRRPALGLTALVAVFLYAAPALAEEKPRERSREQVAFGIEVAQLGLWQEAMYRWSRAVELDPESATARNNLAVAYEQMGEFDRANQEYERALELEPNNVYIRQNYELFREAYERKKRTDRRSGPS